MIFAIALSLTTLGLSSGIRRVTFVGAMLKQQMRTYDLSNLWSYILYLQIEWWPWRYLHIYMWWSWCVRFSIPTKSCMDENEICNSVCPTFTTEKPTLFLHVNSIYWLQLNQYSKCWMIYEVKLLDLPHPRPFLFIWKAMLSFIEATKSIPSSSVQRHLFFQYCSWYIFSFALYHLYFHIL